VASRTLPARPIAPQHTVNAIREEHALAGSCGDAVTGARVAPGRACQLGRSRAVSTPVAGAALLAPCTMSHSRIGATTRSVSLCSHTPSGKGARQLDDDVSCLGRARLLELCIQLPLALSQPLCAHSRSPACCIRSRDRANGNRHCFWRHVSQSSDKHGEEESGAPARLYCSQRAYLRVQPLPSHFSRDTLEHRTRPWVCALCTLATSSAPAATGHGVWQTVSSCKTIASSHSTHLASHGQLRWGSAQQRGRCLAKCGPAYAMERRCQRWLGSRKPSSSPNRPDHPDRLLSRGPAWQHARY